MRETEYEEAVRELSGLIDSGEDPARGELGFARIDALVDAAVIDKREYSSIPPLSSGATDLFLREQIGKNANRHTISSSRTKVGYERGN